MKIRLAALLIVITALIWSFDTKPDYAGMSKTCMGNRGSMAEVVAACSTLMQLDGLSPAQHSRLLSARGWAYYCRSRYDTAIADYDAASALAPGGATPVLRRAMALAASGDVQVAEAEYLNAIALKPDRASLHYYKARFDQGQGRLSDAIDGYEKALDLDPSYGKAGSALASAFLDAGRVKDAEQFLRHAQKQWPDQYWVFDTQVVLALNFTGDVKSALQAVSERVAIKPDPAVEALMRALIHLKIGDEAKGIEQVRLYTVLNQAGHSRLQSWYHSALSWVMFGKSDQWVVQVAALASMGRTDLAKIEIDTFLQDTGDNGRAAVLHLVQSAGIPVSEEARAGSPDAMDYAVDQYLDYLKKQGPFSKYNSPEDS